MPLSPAQARARLGHARQQLKLAKVFSPPSRAGVDPLAGVVLALELLIDFLEEALAEGP